MLTHMFAKPYNRPISNAFQMEAGASAAFQRRAVTRPYRANLDFGTIKEIGNNGTFPAADFGFIPMLKPASTTCRKGIAARCMAIG